MAVPGFDPRPQNEPLLEEIKAAIGDVLQSGMFVGGEAVTGFETAFARRLGVGHAIAVASGTDALLVAAMAAGIGPGDRVATTPFTFFATAGSIARLGATPVFVDVDPDHLQIDPQALERTLDQRPEDAERLRAVIPVHLYGRAGDAQAWADRCERGGWTLIEDCAQAIGATWNGRSVGRFGQAGCYSFYPTKNLGAVGDAGIVVTDDAEFAETVRRLRNHGQDGTYRHAQIGGNFRLDSIQCAALSVKLPHLEAWTEQRRAIAARYDAWFDELGIDELRRPERPEETDHHVYHQYVVRMPRRDEARAFLADRGVGSSVFYPIPLHLQPCFADLGYCEGELPVAERAAREVLALPIYPGLDEDRQREVVDALAEFFGVART